MGRWVTLMPWRCPGDETGNVAHLFNWAMETHRVAQEAVYLFPESRVIDDRYVKKALPVIHEQLAKAAVRVAGVLNRVLGQD